MGTKREEKVYKQPIWFSGRHSLCFSRECLLELESETNQHAVGRKVRKGWMTYEIHRRCGQG